YDRSGDDVPVSLRRRAGEDRRRKGGEGKGEEIMKRASLIFIAFLAFAAVALAEDEKSMPSQKTKEAVDRFNDTPAVVAKKLDALKETIREKLTKGSAQPAAAPTEDPLALPTKKAETPDSPHYSALGKRDPFQAPMKSQA